nr:hypothetical protein [Lapillicoccus sp.]
MFVAARGPSVSGALVADPDSAGDLAHDSEVGVLGLDDHAAGDGVRVGEGLFNRIGQTQRRAARSTVKTGARPPAPEYCTSAQSPTAT